MQYRVGNGMVRIDKNPAEIPIKMKPGGNFVGLGE
jgi:hypothetical protein